MGSKITSHKPVLTQSLFTTVHLPQTSWRSYLTSGVMHALLILALLLIAVPMIRQQTDQRKESVTLIAPVIPAYHPKPLPAPVHAPLIATRKIPAPPVRPKPVPVEHPVEPKPVRKPETLVAVAPHIEPTVPPPAPLPALNPRRAGAPQAGSADRYVSDSARGCRAAETQRIASRRIWRSERGSACEPVPAHNGDGQSGVLRPSAGIRESRGRGTERSWRRAANFIWRWWHWRKCEYSGPSRASPSGWFRRRRFCCGFRGQERYRSGENGRFRRSASWATSGGCPSRKTS